MAQQVPLEAPPSAEKAQPRPLSYPQELEPHKGKDLHELELGKVQAVSTSKEIEKDDEYIYLQGWKLHLMTLGLSISLSLSALELSIVATSLVAITNSLNGFNQITWVATAYLLTYFGFLIILAKLSDILGRKAVLITSIALFIAFSAACGAAQTITQLIILRAFQGIGASGLYSLVFIIFFEMIPESKYPTYTSVVSGTFAASFLLGPLIGGGINNGTTWRWVFLFNVPAASVSLLLLILTLPNGFPNHGRPDKIKKFSWGLLQKLDFLGATLLLAGSILLVTGLQEVANGKAWSSAVVITLLTLSGPLWIVFLIWERYITRYKGVQEPVLPWRFITNRASFGLILVTFLMGGPFMVCLISLPQRFQDVNGISALSAGIRLLPFTIFSPVGNIIAGILIHKVKMQPTFVLMIAGTLQTVGVALLSTISDSKEITASQYGFQIITGLGIGIQFAALVLMTPPAIEKRDLAIATAAVIQFRLMGGAIALAIVTSVFNAIIQPRLSPILSLAQYSELLKTTTIVKTFDPTLQSAVRAIFADAYKVQFRIMIGFAAAEVPAALLTWKARTATT